MKRHATLLVSIFVLAVFGDSAATAHAKPAKPIVYPVKVTIKIKPAELPPDSPWRGVEGIAEYPVIALHGRVTSNQTHLRAQAADYRRQPAELGGRTA